MHWKPLTHHSQAIAWLTCKERVKAKLRERHRQTETCEPNGEVQGGQASSEPDRLLVLGAKTGHFLLKLEQSNFCCFQPKEARASQVPKPKSCTVHALSKLPMDVAEGEPSLSWR